MTTTIAGPDLGRDAPLRQWWALTLRTVGGIVRSGEIIFAFIAPIFLAVCFYLPLREVMNASPGMDYAQFLMPIIALQSVSYVATAAAMRSALDRTTGINIRFRTLPMPMILPALARLSANAVLLGISVSFATIASLVMGWRPGGGVLGTIGMYLIVLTMGVLIALLADSIGIVASNPQAASQTLTLPVLVLGMVSTGFVPASHFPDWIAPFARNQPISQIVNAIRSLDEGTASAATILPAVWWGLGIAALTLFLMFLGTRRRAQ